MAVCLHSYTWIVLVPQTQTFNFATLFLFNCKTTTSLLRMCTLRFIFLVSFFLLFIQSGISELSLNPEVPRCSSRIRLRAGQVLRSPWCWSTLGCRSSWSVSRLVAHQICPKPIIPPVRNSQGLRALLFTHISSLPLAASQGNKALRRGHFHPTCPWARHWIPPPTVDTCLSLSPQAKF